MSDNFKIVSFSAPSGLIKEMQEVAKREHRTLSELLRECFRQYASIRDLRSLAAKGKKAAKARKVNRKDIGYEVE
jgi:hypothetical protein